MTKTADSWLRRRIYGLVDAGIGIAARPFVVDTVAAAGVAVGITACPEQPGPPSRWTRLKPCWHWQVAAPIAAPLPPATDARGGTAPERGSVWMAGPQEVGAVVARSTGRWHHWLGRYRRGPAGLVAGLTGVGLGAGLAAVVLLVVLFVVLGGWSAKWSAPMPAKSSVAPQE